MRILSTLLLCLFATSICAEDIKVKIAIIKADDIKGPSAAWDRFFSISSEKGVKVSAGIVCNSLQPHNEQYVAWLKQYASSCQIEFWNHGWNHKRWKTEDQQAIYEFQSSGYEHQKKHFTDSQQIMAGILGDPPIAFGAPYNKIDQDTIRVMNEDSNIAFYFGYSKPAGLDRAVFARMKLRGEHDGTGKPNFEKFIAAYADSKNENISFSAIQFHPNKFTDEHFDAYAKILDFLLEEGWQFMLPREYVAYRNTKRSDAS